MRTWSGVCGPQSGGVLLARDRDTLTVATGLEVAWLAPFCPLVRWGATQAGSSGVEIGWGASAVAEAWLVGDNEPGRRNVWS